MLRFYNPKFYKKAAKLNPKNKTALNNLGLAHQRLKNYDSAIECFEKGIELDPFIQKNISKNSLHFNMVR